MKKLILQEEDGRFVINNNIFYLFVWQIIIYTNKFFSVVYEAILTILKKLRLNIYNN